MSDESTLRKAVTAALVFLENAVVTERAVALRDVAGARPLITSLRAALAAPSAATGSGDAASRDAVAEVLAPLVAKARRPVPKMDGSHNPNPADLAIAREMADAVLPRWRDAAPRGEAVAMREACADVVRRLEPIYSTDEGWARACGTILSRITALPLPAAPAPIATAADDAVREAAKRVADCEPVDWDCSRAPGHPGLDAMIAAVANLRRALAAERAAKGGDRG